MSSDTQEQKSLNAKGANGTIDHPRTALTPVAMTFLLRLSRLIAIFVGAAGFLFGQVFAGEFGVAGTLAGVGGVAAGILASFTWRASTRIMAIAACAIGLLGAGLHAYDYYSVPQLPGNYYAWFLTAPFAIALLFIAIHAARRGEGGGGPSSS